MSNLKYYGKKQKDKEEIISNKMEMYIFSFA